VTISNINFSLKAGDALAIVGRSGSGKSTLMRVLVGIWPVLRGAVRLDGATMDQWAADDLGQRIGYVPQNIELFDGTIAQNISRFDPAASAEKVIAAAKAADVHDLIVHLPGGYEYQLGPGGGNLSAGQKQRVALARALYDDPFLIVLDEPNSNLDTDGEAALGVAMEGARARGAIVIIVAHRPAVLSRVDYIMVMANGQIRDFGTRTEILARLKLLPQQPPGAPQQNAEPPPPADKELTHGE
jgi:ATP-binding cassette, subfamily C, bacterial PrsD